MEYRILRIAGSICFVIAASWQGNMTIAFTVAGFVLIFNGAIESDIKRHQKREQERKDEVETIRMLRDASRRAGADV